MPLFSITLQERKTGRAHAGFLPRPPSRRHYSLISPLLHIFASLLSDEASPEGFFGAPPQTAFSGANQHLILANIDFFWLFKSASETFFAMASSYYRFPILFFYHLENEITIPVLDRLLYLKKLTPSVE
jgi:hypothetical protein